MINAAFFINTDTQYEVSTPHAAIYLKLADEHGTEIELVVDADPDEMHPDDIDAQANDIETAAAEFATRIREASAAIRRGHSERIRKATL